MVVVISSLNPITLIREDSSEQVDDDEEAPTCILRLTFNSTLKVLPHEKVPIRSRQKDDSLSYSPIP